MKQRLESFAGRHQDGLHEAIFIGKIASVPVVLLGIVAGIGSAVNHYDNEAVFQRQYTDEGQCLHGTPFDSDWGGVPQPHITETGEQQLIVFTTSMYKQAERPTHLTFDVLKDTAIATPIIVPANDETALYTYSQWDGSDNCGPR